MNVHIGKVIPTSCLRLRLEIDLDFQLSSVALTMSSISGVKGAFCHRQAVKRRNARAELNCCNSLSLTSGGIKPSSSHYFSLGHQINENIPFTEKAKSGEISDLISLLPERDAQYLTPPAYKSSRCSKKASLMMK